MKMQEHFALPVSTHRRDIYGSDDWFAATCFNSTSAAAAAHAINCHDELVEALERMVVEGQNIYIALAQMGWGAEDFRKAAENAVNILTKAKGADQ